MRLQSWMVRWLVVAPTLAAGGYLLNACRSGTDTTPAPSGSYVGRVANSDAFVAIVTNGSDVRAYICDGTADGRLTVSEWFKGTTSGTAAQLNSESGAARLTVELTSGAATGTITLPDNTTLTFTAVRDDGDAGFYLFKNPRGDHFYWAGWIVLPTGEQRGSVLVGTTATPHASLNLSTQTAQIAAIGTVTAGKLTVARVAQGFQGCYPCLQCC